MSGRRVSRAEIGSPAVSSEPELQLADVVVEDADFSGRHAESARFDGTELRRVSLAETRLPGVRLRDVRAEEIDASNAYWAHGELDHVALDGSRLVGTGLQHVSMRDVVFDHCRLDYVNLRFAKLDGVVFRSCTFTDADLQGARLRSCRFAACELVGTDITGVDLFEVDLRSSRLAFARAHESLRGATIDTVQLVELAPVLEQVLGIAVADEDDLTANDGASGSRARTRDARASRGRER